MAKYLIPNKKYVRILLDGTVAASVLPSRFDGTLKQGFRKVINLTCFKGQFFKQKISLLKSITSKLFLTEIDDLNNNHSKKCSQVLQVKTFFCPHSPIKTTNLFKQMKT